jgi:hypothetical protein
MFSRAFVASMIALIAGCSDTVDPREYGGGDKGRAIAQCIERSERQSGLLTREEAGRACTCLSKRIAAGEERPISRGSVIEAENERALMRCVADGGIGAE